MKQIFVVLWAFILLAGCTTEINTLTPTKETTSAQLTPYPSATASLTPTPTDPATPTPLPSPTPTPRTHVLKDGQDLFGLSLYYNVPLEDLLAMNPSVNPNAMTVGATILIPPERSQPANSLPTATPVPLQLDLPDCQVLKDGSGVCFVMAHNPLETRLEAVSAVVRVQSAGQVISQAAYLPLDGIPPGGTIPLIAFFAGPLQEPLLSSAELLTAIPLNAQDERHLTVQVAPVDVVLSEDRLSANVSGTMQITASAEPASRVWVLAVAYNSKGRPVGYRRWESLQLLAAGQNLTYSLSVYSTGETINRVEVFAEARR